MNWHTLSPAWQAAFEEAWAAYCSDAVPIGAAIVNESGVVVARGRNTVCGTKPTDGVLYGNKLCHAEVNALFGINERSHPAYQSFTLYATMEPCPLCFGALVMSKLRRCHFAARDLVAGCAQLVAATPYLQQRQLVFAGPVNRLEQVQIALLSEFILRHRPAEAAKLLSAWKESSPDGVALGQRLFDAGTLNKAREGRTEFAKLFEILIAEFEQSLLTSAATGWF